MCPARRSRPSARVGLVPALVAALALAACGSGDDVVGGGHSSDGSGDSGSSGTTGERIAIDGDEALRWGDGAYGVVLAHGAAFDAASWEEQARAIADQGATVLAVENIDPDAIAAAAGQLHSDGVDDVALVGGSAGADAILDLSSEQPDLADQLVLLSPNGTVDGLGEQPKLFIASENEPVADVAPKLAETAPGSENESLLLPGSDHAQNIFAGEQSRAATDAMLQRLRQFG